MADQSSYSRTRERLEEIVTQIKAKDIPLEKSLDLYEEALRLGSTCAEMIDRTDFSAEELENATDEVSGSESVDADTARDAVVNSPSDDETDEADNTSPDASSDDEQPGEPEGETASDDDE